ncbi:MAG: DNA-3-methyladenine glycosylase I [Rhodospirillales bacterium]|nr:DNA-3-methyladenine glycosylase I [Rhodospirillales bacterium]
MSSYCLSAPGHAFHGPYHDREYGFPTRDETILFERLAMEIMQAGLSWLLILKKRDGLNKAFAGFHVDTVASFTDDDVARLLGDETIIRNRLKILAIIENAKRLQAMRETHTGFANWLAACHPLTKAEWVKLFKKTFKFTGGEITGEFLMSVGYLPGAHDGACPVSNTIMDIAPPWMGPGAAFYV